MRKDKQMPKYQGLTRCLLLAMLGSGLIGGGYGQAWLAMVDLFPRDRPVAHK
ncbi:hypothetical protein [Levilactobacillus sp. HBUAS70063]|uniref:hypothetical protein n=1 Tax=Levilactobacillus sp. HBUAS70063 TaxID=3109359 RepID=UPI003132CF92